MTDLKSSTDEDQQSLPRELGNGLTLRWSGPEDIEAIVQFVNKIFANDGQVDEELTRDVYDWLGGKNPTTGPTDFTLVTDATGQIVSCMTLMSQTRRSLNGRVSDTS